MSVTRIASRYAKSLIDLAIEQDKLETVLEDIQYFNKALESRELYLMLKSPIINVTKKATIFKALFDDKFDKITLSFLDIILRKGREYYLPDIAKSFVHLYKDLKHISTVKLKTAVPLSDSLLADIKAKLEDSKETYEEIELITEVDQDLLGGFVVEFGDKLYDASIAHKLEQMHKEFGDNHYVSKL